MLNHLESTLTQKPGGGGEVPFPFNQWARRGWVLFIFAFRVSFFASPFSLFHFLSARVLTSWRGRAPAFHRW